MAVMAKLIVKKPSQTGQLRCAIYTRKSTDEGLDQEFNSLDAQREACAAYILSQRHEGWTLLPEIYDDGGFSGGNMDRPAFQRLLAAVQAGEVDIIVVYKVDRLTRSLADFAKIVEILDAQEASFVSVTQAFNTTTSMGRLTLNVLLSFAQFEREVTSERIRDKIAASKKKGIWMGGNIPLGYDVRERKLVVKDDEAETVRLIFDLYLEFGSTPQLAEKLASLDIRSRQRVLADGRLYGGGHFTVGALQQILTNPVYLGEIRHKGVTYPGEHDAILSRDVWDKVQAALAERRANHSARVRARYPSLLARMLIDGEGRNMIPSHTNRHGKRYRYYITAPTSTRKRQQDGWYIPAGELEAMVMARVTACLSDKAAMSGLKGCEAVAPAVVERLGEIASSIETMSPIEQRQLLVDLETQIALDLDGITIAVKPQRLVADLMGLGPDAEVSASQLLIAVSLVRRGRELRLQFSPDDNRAPARHDTTLIQLIAKAEQAYRQLTEEPETIEPARRKHLVRMARLKFLAPDIVGSILDGRQPVSLNARYLLRAPALPLCWKEQRTMLGFA
jgi:site-specific DNA recombinase